MIKQESIDRYEQGIFNNHKQVVSFLKHKIPNKDFIVIGTSSGNVSGIIIKDGKLSELKIKFYWASGDNGKQWKTLYNFILTGD